LTDAIIKTRDTTGNGEQALPFSDADATGSARRSRSNPEGEIRFSISDAAGRSGHDGMLMDSSDLITWTCNVHDPKPNPSSGYGTVLGSRRASNAIWRYPQKASPIAAGRTIKAFDTLGKITSYEYDAAGNQLQKVATPKRRQLLHFYDALGRRRVSCNRHLQASRLSSLRQSTVTRFGSDRCKSKHNDLTFDARGLKLGHPFYWCEAAAMCLLTKISAQFTPHEGGDHATKAKMRITDPNSVQVFHLVQRLLRSAWLCGEDPHSGSLMSIAGGGSSQSPGVSGIDLRIDCLDLYTVLSNHMHLV